MAIDKPAGWLLVPDSWDRTPRNLQAAIGSALRAGSFWAKSRHLRFLRYVHRLDGDTTGVLLLAKSPGGVHSYGELFESRKMSKKYLAVVHGRPREEQWVCRAAIDRDPQRIGRMRIDSDHGKASETEFRLLRVRGERSLIEARPLTGRTHQIRLHLLESGLPIVGDDQYGPDAVSRKPPLKYRREFPMGLRASALKYDDPFLRRTIHITASSDAFLRAFDMEARVAGDSSA